MILTTMMCVSTDTSSMKMVSTTQHRDVLMVTTMNPGGREMVNLVKNMEMEHINVLVAAPGATLMENQQDMIHLEIE